MAGGGGGEATSTRKSAFEVDSLVKPKASKDDSSFDITAMIDLVFMMNIFFLVTTLTKSMSGVDLPTANICQAADEEECIILVLRATHDRETPEVSIGGGEFAKLEADAHDIDDEIKEGLEEGVRAGKNKALIKAEKNIPLKHVARIASVVGSVPDAQPLFAVLELDKKE